MSGLLERVKCIHHPGHIMIQFNKRTARVRFSQRRIQVAVLSTLLAVAVALPGAGGQTAKQPASQDVDLTMTANEVSLNLVVHDKKNKPVLDLKPEEIAVSDNGTPVQLNSFHLVNGAQKSECLITLVFDRPVQLAGKNLEADPTIMKNAREAAGKILAMVPEKGFSISVLTAEDRLRLESSFTSDRKSLTQAIGSATEPKKVWNGGEASPLEKQLITAALTGVGPEGKAVSVHDRALDKLLVSAITGSGKIAQNQHFQPFLAGLLALAQFQQQIHQRKVLIFFTAFQEEKNNLRTKEAIQSIIGAANRAGESIYVVDVNSSNRVTSQMSSSSAEVLGFALGGPTSGGADGLTSTQGKINSMGMEGYMQLVQSDRNNDDMKALAGETGGSYIPYDQLRKSLAQMLQDMTTYYVATYVPPIKEYDGKFRSIAIKPLRAKLKIRTQSGYLALPPQSGGDAAPQPFELPLLRILGQEKLPADIPFHAAILSTAATADGEVSTLAIEVPHSGLEIHDDNSTGIHSASLSIVANIKDKSGEIIEHFSEDIPRRRIQKDSDSAEFGAISFQRHFLAPPGEYILEAAVLDHYTAKAGARRTTFEVPDTTAVPSLGNMILVREAEPLRADDDTAEPLRHGNEILTPNLSGRLMPGAKVISVFLSTHTDPHTAEPSALKIQIYRDGKPLGGEPMTVPQTRGSEFASYLSSFSINPPVNGAYEVKAVLSQGGRSAESSTAFEVTGGQQSGDIEIASVLDAPLPAHPSGPLAITIPANPIERPSVDEINSILADATKYAMTYRDTLPNFMCEQVTDRYIYHVNLGGTGQWDHKDKSTELLTYFEHEENRSLLEREQNGSISSDDTENARGATSDGEFSFTLSGIFRPSSKTDFQWKEIGVLGDGTVQVFDYRVAPENSTFNLRASSTDVITVGYHGQVYIDTVTRMVRRITKTADNVPPRYPIQGAMVNVDYDFLVLNNHDYMLPISAQVILKKGRGELDMNQIDFQNFRRFGSDTRIVNDGSVAKP
ncbi:MAG: VWA domain-containing protein [Terracidiphilus sp.]